MARPRVNSRDHKRHGIMMDYAQNRDTVLGSIVDTVGRAYRIAFRERDLHLDLFSCKNYEVSKIRIYIWDCAE